MSTINMKFNVMGDVFYVISFIIISLTWVPTVLAYYCNHDLCREDQYCCGDNLCCDYVYSLWYFWFGFGLLVIVLSLCGGFFRYCYDNSYAFLKTCKLDYYAPNDEEKALSSSVENINGEQPSSYSKNYEKSYDLYNSEHEAQEGNRLHFQNARSQNLLVHF